jgi:flagellar hook-associated protein 1 FlgK
MGVNFSPFEIGRRALRATQFGLTLTGQNIANVNTPGYTRQSAQLAAAPPDGASRALVGTGVTIEGARSARDRFIETRLQTETAISGRLTAQRDALAPVDTVLNESGTNGGISNALTNFFGAFRELEAHPTSVPLRAVVTESGTALASAFHSTRTRLTEIRHDADSVVRGTVDEVNTLAANIASLNARIANAENTRTNSSELRDQRGEALRRLSGLTGARSVEDPSGQVTVTLGDGRALVIADRVASFTAVSTPPDDLAALTLDGRPAALTDGKLRGLLDAIDEISAQIDTLDQFAAEVAARVNGLHTSGTDLAGNPGGHFFEVPAGGAPVTAANLTVSPALQANPRLIVSSPLAAPQTAATVAGAIANLLTEPGSQVGARTGSLNSIFSSIIAEAGTTIKVTEDALAVQQAILAQTSAQRESVSGVSLDEEAVNLLQYQRAYEAAARFLKIADELTQTILSLG